MPPRVITIESPQSVEFVDDSDDESDLFQNTNRPVYEESEDSDTDTESEED